MKSGLILEGGAMRGMFTAGVTDVLMENNINFNGIIGVSAGACFGCNYKSHQIGRAIRYNLKYCNDKRYCGIYSLITDGNIYNSKFCYDEIPNKLDKFDLQAFKNDSTEFYVVCTDIVSGDPVYKKCDNFDKDFEWMRASASMPLVSKIVEIDNLKLLDGGMSDSIPIKYFESIGFDRNIVILTQPKYYEKSPNKFMPLIKKCYKDYPGLVKAMEERHLKYNETLKYIEEKENNNEILVIRPKAKLMVKRVEKNPLRLQKIYDEGRKEGLKRLEDIKKFLNN